MQYFAATAPYYLLEYMENKWGDQDVFFDNYY